MAFVFSQDGLLCSVCLNLLQDPVTFPCGHSCCMNCITDCWNNQTQAYSCSQCQLTQRPAFGNNVMFAEVMEKLEMFNFQTALPAHSNTRPEDVECDICTLSKNKAVKSCLECLKSYCQTHLEEHNISYIFNQHNLMEPTRRLKEVICPKHRKHLEIYCRTDKQCICHLCTMEEHVNHEYLTVKAERTEKQGHLREIRRKVHQRIQEREQELQEVREAVESYKRSVQTAEEDSERIFTDLIRSIQTCHLKVAQLIRDQGITALSQAESFWNQLQQEIADLKMRDAELEQLSHIDDHIHFLQSFQSVSVAPESTVSHNISVSSLFSFDDVRKSVSQLKEDLEDFCKEDIEDISKRVTYITIIRPNEPKTRKEFLQYASEFTLDSNTVNHYLCLSDGNRTATDTDIQQNYPYHSERFEYCAQVLCKESVCGRCYWEVEWTGSAGVYISVAYRTISRKTNEDKDLFGQNDQSWGVYCCPSSHYTPSSFHPASVNAGAYPRLPQAIGRQITWTGGQTMTGLPAPTSCSKIGVYVDHSAGTLSFYSISDTMTLIHKVQTTFTQPLYPGFYVCKGSTVKMCDFTK